MSTDVPETPEMAKAKAKRKDKHKKNKGYTDNNTKKRKRDREEAVEVEKDVHAESNIKKRKREREEEVEVEQDVQTTKKPKQEGEEEVATEANNTKKRKADREEVVKKNVAPDSQPVARPAKKQKKDKHGRASTSKPVTASNEGKLVTQSPFVKQTTSFYLPLSPCAYHFPLEGLCAEHISPLLLTYYPPVGGVVISYSSPRLSEHANDGLQVDTSDRTKAVLSRCIDEYAVTYIWLTAEFLLFKPRRGTYLEGYVSLQNEGILGLVCYNYFNAVIEREKLPEDWRWEEDGDDVSDKGQAKRTSKAVAGAGYFVDGQGQKIEGRIVFRVEDFEATPGSDSSTGTASILGTLKSEGEET